MAVATSTNDLQEVVFVYQSLDAIDQTRAETTRIIFLTAGIAIILTTIFAFFLSTRISSPLIKMREAALDLTRGEFDTKRSEEHTSELQSRGHLVCRLLLEKKNKNN